MKRICAEYEDQKAICLLFPYRNDVWRENARPAQKMIVRLANSIADFERVILGVLPELEGYVKDNFTLHQNIRLVPVKYNDCWARDTLSSVVLDDGKEYVNAFGFNSYGVPLYTPYNDDIKLNHAIFGGQFGYSVYDVDVILEWGNLMPDGAGTIFAVEETIVNDNRNSGKSKEEIEQIILEKTGSKKVVWIPKGLPYDETGGHIDNVLSFADSETILVSFTDDPKNVHYERTREIYSQLERCTNAEGKKYKLVKMPIPNIHERNAKDSSKLCYDDISVSRLPGDMVLYTYVNFVTVNGAIIVPSFGLPEDAVAKTVLKKAFPTRKIIQLDAREAFLGGGGFHCLTKHIN